MLRWAAHVAGLVEPAVSKNFLVMKAAKARSSFRVGGARLLIQPKVRLIAAKSRVCEQLWIQRNNANEFNELKLIGQEHFYDFSCLRSAMACGRTGSSVCEALR